MKTILVVEDDKEYRTILQEELTSQGFHVLTAENGRIALEIVQKEPIDLILLDLLMPEMDGKSFYFQLKNKLKKKIPIIVLTNVSDITAYSENIKAVLIKANVSLSEVVKTVREYI